MKILTKIMMATTLAATTATSFAVPAEARHHRHHYYGRTYYGHRYCRYSSGTTGLVAGGVAGAVVGHNVIGVARTAIRRPAANNNPRQAPIADGLMPALVALQEACRFVA